MNARIRQIQETVSAALNKLPDVFSTVQWGGRAYKVQLPGHGKRNFKLLAHLWVSDEEDAVGIAFKLDRKRAQDIVEQFDWIEPHSFRTLAPAGWVSARIQTKSQCAAVIRLLRESREQYPKTSDGLMRSGKPRHEVDTMSRRIEVVVLEKMRAGWSPNQDDDFDR